MKENWIALQTLIIKEILRFARIWVQTIVPPVITTGLYFLIFGRLIGSRIGSMDGYSYIQFIVPGLVMMAIITNSYSNVVSSFYHSKFAHYVEELIVSPTPNILILLGYVTGGVARGLIVGSVVVGVSLLFTHLHIYNIALTVIIAILTATLFSLAGFINAVFANSFDDISIVPTFVLTPLTYLGGVFYSINMLPHLWKNISLANPILYMINAFRLGMLGSSDIPLGISIIVILGFILALGSFSLFLLKKGIGIRS